MSDFLKKLFNKEKKKSVNCYVDSVVVSAVETTTINSFTDVIAGRKEFDEAINDIAQQGARAAVNEYVANQLPPDSPLRKAVLNAVNGQQSLDEALGDMIQQKVQTVVTNCVHSGTKRIMPRSLSGSSFENSVATNITDIIINDKELEEALSSIAQEGARTAVNRYIGSENIAEMSRLLFDSTDAVKKLLNDANVSGEILTAFVESTDTLFRWVNGEIPTHRCLLDLGEKASSLAVSGYSAAIGQALIPIPVIGAVVGDMIGSALTSGLYKQLTAGLRQRELEYQARQQRILQYNLAAEAERQYRQELETYLEEYFREYRHYFDSALSEIDAAFASGNAEGVVYGANKITRKLGGTVQYETFEEFEDFLNSDKPFIL